MNEEDYDIEDFNPVQMIVKKPKDETWKKVEPENFKERIRLEHRKTQFQVYFLLDKEVDQTNMPEFAKETQKKYNAQYRNLYYIYKDDQLMDRIIHTAIQDMSIGNVTDVKGRIKINKDEMIKVLGEQAILANLEVFKKYYFYDVNTNEMDFKLFKKFYRDCINKKLQINDDLCLQAWKYRYGHVKMNYK